MNGLLDSKLLDQTPEEKIFHEIEKTLEVITESKTASPAIKLALYNFFKQNPDYKTEDLDREIAKLDELAMKEESYKNNNKVPTVGTELEFPIEWITKNESDTLTILGVKNEPEPQYDHLHEVNQHFSYSSETQARVIEELKKARIIRVSDDQSLSLHVNFGVPKNLISREDFQDVTNLADFFVNVSTITYASVQRIDTRKSANTFIAHATDVEKNEKTGNLRFEIKTLGFENLVAYRAVEELQMICAAYFASIKKKYDSGQCDGEDNKLQTIWDEFVDEFIQLIDKYHPRGDSPIGIYSNYGQCVLLLKEHPEINEEARLIFSKYAREVKSLLFGDK